MRLLLWVLLVTLVTLFTSTDAASSTIANADTTLNSGAIGTPTATTLAVSPADGKRRLRVHYNDDATDDEDDADEPYTDEERAISISNIFQRMKTAIRERSKSMADVVKIRTDKNIESKAMALYNEGATPISLQAMRMGSGGGKKTMVFYKQWYDKNVAAGVIKALD